MGRKRNKKRPQRKPKVASRKQNPWIKRGLVASAIAFGLYTIQYNSTIPEQPTSPSGIEIVTNNHLTVNTSPDIRNIVTLPEQEGIEQLRYLATTSPVEEEWIYFPSSNLWVELGVSEDMTGLLSSPYPVNHLIQENATTPGTTYFHIHVKKPDWFINEQANSFLEDLIHTSPEMTFEDAKETFLIMDKLPAIRDISKMIRATVSNANSGFDVPIHKQVSELGVAEWSMNPDMIGMFSGIQDPRINQYALDLYEQSLTDYVRMVRNSEGSLTEKIQDAAALTTNEVVNVTFTPHEQ